MALGSQMLSRALRCASTENKCAICAIDASESLIDAKLKREVLNYAIACHELFMTKLSIVDMHLRLLKQRGELTCAHQGRKKGTSWKLPFERCLPKILVRAKSMNDVEDHMMVKGQVRVIRKLFLVNKSIDEAILKLEAMRCSVICCAPAMRSTPSSSDFSRTSAP